MLGIDLWLLIEILVGDSKKLEKYTSNTHVWLGTMKAKKINALLPTIVYFIVYILYILVLFKHARYFSRVYKKGMQIVMFLCYILQKSH